MFVNKVLRKESALRAVKLTSKRKKLHNEENNLQDSSNTTRAINSSKMKWPGT
jgi:hypothetical protein